MQISKYSEGNRNQVSHNQERDRNEEMGKETINGGAGTEVEILGLSSTFIIHMNR